MSFYNKASAGLSYFRTLRNWPDVVRGHLTGSWPSQLVLRDDTRIDLLDSAAEIWAFRSIFWEQCYECSLPPLRRDGVVIDLGANVGIFSVYAATHLVPQGRVFCVEPDPNCYQVLAKNTLQNGLRNMVPLNAALAATEGTANFWKGLDSLGGSLYEEIPASAPIAVPTITLESLLSEVERVDLLKANMEGGEYDLIDAPESCWRKIERVSIKYHEGGPGRKHSSRELAEFLKQNGFEVCRWEPIWATDWGHTGIITARQSCLTNCNDSLIAGVA